MTEVQTTTYELDLLGITRRSYVFRFLSAEHSVECSRTYFGPMLKAFESLDTAGQNALARDLEELLEYWNDSGDETSVVPGDYLEIEAVRNRGE